MWNSSAFSYVDFYHYTSERAIDAIIESGYINESQSGGPDAFYGTGERKNFKFYVEL